MLRKKIEVNVTKTRSEVLEGINKLIQYSDYVNGYVYNRKGYDVVIVKPSPVFALIMVLVGIVIFNLSINFQLKILKGRLSQ